MLQYNSKTCLEVDLSPILCNHCFVLKVLAEKLCAADFISNCAHISHILVY